MTTSSTFSEGVAGADSGAPSRSLRGADLLAETLIATGISHIFGVPGDTGVVLYDALAARADRLQHVLARDERHAAAMADAYARVSGRVGAVEVSSGGGTTYVVGGLGEAFAAGSPVLLITSDIHSSSRGTGALTEIDQQALFSAVTKESFLVSSAEEIPDALSAALEVATTGKPGPVAVILPEDVLDEMYDAPSADFSNARVSASAADVPHLRTAASSSAVREAVGLLNGASRPAILLGGGVHYSSAYGPVAHLAARVGAHVATTIHGKGGFAEDSLLSVGVTGNNGGNARAIETLGAADVTVIIGSRANATDTDSFTAPPRDSSIIAVDIDPTCVNRNYPDALVLQGDAATVVGQILDGLDIADGHEPVDDSSSGDSAKNVGLSDGQSSSERDEATALDKEGKLLVTDVISALAETLEEFDPIVVADPGTPTPAIADGWRVTSAGRRTVVPRGHGPMGFAVPAAVGVAMAEPGRTVLSLTADGSFAMCCGELETIARFGLPAIIIQFTNHSMGWIKMLQHLYLGGRYFGVDPGPIDSAMVARACGIDAAHVTDLEELKLRVSKAAAEGRPLFLDVDVPHMIDVVPQVPAWHRALAGDPTRPVY